jgi:TPR repeat protein
MRPYVRPLVVTFSALALACLFSYAAIALTETTPAAAPKAKSDRPVTSVTLTKEQRAAAAFEQIKREAASGDPQHITTLANCYLWGRGTAKDEVEATRLHRIAAEKKHPFAMYMYGSALRLGIGVQKDVAAGVAIIRAAAETGLPEAEYEMYELLTVGKDIKADHAAARKWQLIAAEHGYHSARADLAEEIINAKDVKRFKSVANWVRDGAMAGHDRCAHIMSFVYEQGLGTPVDPVESMAWRLISLNVSDELDPKVFREDYDALTEEQQESAEKRARELSGKRKYASPYARDPAELAAERKHFDETLAKAKTGDAEARYELSRLFYVGEGTKKDKDESNRWCLMAAEQGLASAQCMWGLTLLKGDGVTPDAKQAAEWFRKSAVQGHPRSEFILGLFYRDGTGMKADHAESTKWLTQAAEHGYADAQYELGNELYGEEADSAKDAIAARWFRKSAEQFQPNGCFSLGRCYLNGRGLVRNKIEGLAWMLMRAEKLGQESKEELTRTLGEFGEDEIKRASERSQQLQAELEAKLEAK